jgi:hypothetical protein
MTRARDYSKLNARDKRNRGQAEFLSDSQARAVIRLVDRQHKLNRVPARSKILARDIVINYEGTDAYLLDLQSKHADNPEWVPGASATSTILTIVRYSGFDTAAA